ncbi:hypothetical protein SDC9_150885 [bioreactor metagenome]|uniref:Uncharacterized protein n=1 Tax=bioreactor metagenome TaxID=1076179 RepID=A0A645ET28_9ZZZZ
MKKCGIILGQSINFSAAALASFIASSLTKEEVEILTVFLQSLAQSLGAIIIADDVCTGEDDSSSESPFIGREIPL